MRDDIIPTHDCEQFTGASAQHVIALKGEFEAIVRRIASRRAAMAKHGDPDGQRAKHIRDCEERLDDLQREAIAMPA